MEHPQAATPMPRKTCYYEVLGLDRKCDAAEIKSAYRKLALTHHPDKAHINNVSVEEATSRFQQIQEAYSVLSDPQERAWYDSHREQILRGDDEPGEDPFKTKINLYRYFSSGCYADFGDGPEGFYAVYSGLFRAIDKEEEEWEDADEEHVTMPSFGHSSSEWRDVSSFYKHWLDFCSRKAFGHADKWNTRDGENRQVRRAMEQENKKARAAAKKEFNAEVRQLVKFVEKRDPRVAAHRKQQARESAEKAQREAAEKERRKKEEAKEREERKAAQRREEEERWREVEAAKEARRARGEVVSGDEEDSSDEEEEEAVFNCEACRKTFKSEKAYDQHTKSKKHQQAVAKLRQQMDRELREQQKAQAKAAPAASSSDEGEEEEEEDEEEEESEDHTAAAAADETDRLPPMIRGTAAVFSPPQRAAAAPKRTAAATDGDNANDAEGSDDDEFLTQFAARGRGGASASASRRVQNCDGAANGAASESGSKEQDADDNAAAAEDGEDLDDITMLGGKRSQKKGKQQALLLQRHRDGDQEPVRLSRKAQRAARRGDGDGEGPRETMATTASAGSPDQQDVRCTVVGQQDVRCTVCGEVFPSRSKMFQHIKATGHAALKEAPVVETSKGGRRKKK